MQSVRDLDHGMPDHFFAYFIAFLQYVADLLFTEALVLHVHYRVVQLRIERLVQRFNLLKTAALQHLSRLGQRHLHAVAQASAVGAALYGALQVIDNRQQRCERIGFGVGIRLLLFY